MKKKSISLTEKILNRDVLFALIQKKKTRRKPQEMALITSTRNERHELFIHNIHYLTNWSVFFCIIPPISNNENNNNASRPALGCVNHIWTKGIQMKTVKKKRAHTHTHTPNTILNIILDNLKNVEIYFLLLRICYCCLIKQNFLTQTSK